MTRAIVAVRRRDLTSGIPARVEVGHVDELPNGELELHIHTAHDPASERLIVEAPMPLMAIAEPGALNTQPRPCSDWHVFDSDATDGDPCRCWQWERWTERGMVRRSA